MDTLPQFTLATTRTDPYCPRKMQKSNTTLPSYNVIDYHILI